MKLFLCVNCSPRYDGITKLMPDASFHRDTCADCGKLRDGYDYYTGAKPPKPDNPFNRRNVCRRRNV